MKKMITNQTIMNPRLTLWYHTVSPRFTSKTMVRIEIKIGLNHEGQGLCSTKIGC